MKQIQTIEQNNQRVLTTAQLAESYGAEEKLIQQNFSNNKSRYKEGKHFFLLQGKELRKFKGEYANYGIASNTNKLYLWTFRGCVLHASSLRNVPVDRIYGIANIFGIDTDNLVVVGDCSKEYEFERLLESVIPSNLRLEKQFVIGTYRLDFYFPSIGLIIEFDENAHKFTKLADKKREIEIKELLPNVQFIRVRETDIYSGIKQITSFIYNKIGGIKYVTSNY